MLGLLLVLITSATEARVVIVERSTLGIAPSVASQLRARLELALEQVRLEVTISAESCGDRACLMALARAQRSCVVGMTLVKNRKGLTVDLEAVDGESVVLQQTFLLSSERLEKSPEAQVFAHQLGARLVKDAPVVEPTPEPKLTVPVVEARPEWLEPTPAPAGPRVLAGISGGVGAAGLGLLIASAVVKGTLESSLKEQPVITSLTRPQAQQQAELANGLLGGGLVALAVALAGGTTALVMGLSAD